MRLQKWFLVAVAVTTAIALAGCRGPTTPDPTPDPDPTPLAAPTGLEIVDGVLSWTAVAGASGYRVYTGENTIGSTASAVTTFALADANPALTAAGNPHQISVRALGVEGQSLNSPRSAPVEFTVGDDIVADPREALRAAIEAAEARLEDEDDYTEESWAAFIEALEEARLVYADQAADEGDLAAALGELQNAMAGLTTPAVAQARGLLQAAITAATVPPRVQANYTTASWNAFASALAAAQAAMTSTVVADINAARTALDTAMNDLVTLVAQARGLLQAAITAATVPPRVQANYTTASWNVFASALAAAQAAMTSTVVADINAARTELDNARENLAPARTGPITITFGGFPENPLEPMTVTPIALTDVVGTEIEAEGDNLEDVRWYRGESRLSDDDTLVLDGSFAFVGNHLVTVRATYDGRPFSQLVQIRVVAD